MELLQNMVVRWLARGTSDYIARKNRSSLSPLLFPQRQSPPHPLLQTSVFFPRSSASSLRHEGWEAPLSHAAVLSLLLDDRWADDLK